jgi:hypothetical protein
MSLVQVRKFATTVEEVFHEGGPAAANPFKQGACLAVIRNPYAGRYEPNIQPFMKDLEPLGVEMAKRLISAMGVPAKAIEAYGKGAIVGPGGEIEHEKVGGAGARLDVPLAHINAAYVRSHFSAMEVGLPDAPRDDEIVFILTMSTGARVHDRAGGLKASEIKGEDGLR